MLISASSLVEGAGANNRAAKSYSGLDGYLNAAFFQQIRSPATARFRVAVTLWTLIRA